MENAAAGPRDLPIERNSSDPPAGVNPSKPAARSRRKYNENDIDEAKRRCVSTACTYDE